MQVLEITKLSERGSGPQTVHVDSFEGNNLVFVDEGHRGSSGDVWMGLRDKVAAEGFTFEYSATFGEALNGGNKQGDFEARQGYGKAIVFDYRYKYFHDDGYGKDFAILNLPRGYDPAYGDVLLLGNLLAFYEQMRLYADAGRSPVAVPHRAAAAGLHRSHRADRQEQERPDRRRQTQPERCAQHGAFFAAGRHE